MAVPSVTPELKVSLQIILAERLHIEAFTCEPAAQMRHKVELVGRRIYLIRGQRVMLDSDLAELYQVETRVLVQAVKRNLN